MQRRGRPDLGSSVSGPSRQDRKSTRLNSSHSQMSYAVFCLKQNKTPIAAGRGQDKPAISRSVVDCRSQLQLTRPDTIAHPAHVEKPDPDLTLRTTLDHYPAT